jgi:hypothetical protein
MFQGVGNVDLSAPNSRQWSLWRGNTAVNWYRRDAPLNQLQSLLIESTSSNFLMVTYRFMTLSDDDVSDTDVGGLSVLRHSRRWDVTISTHSRSEGGGGQQVDLSALKQVYAFTDCSSIGRGIVWLDEVTVSLKSLSSSLLWPVRCNGSSVVTYIGLPVLENCVSKQTSQLLRQISDGKCDPTRINENTQSRSVICFAKKPESITKMGGSKLNWLEHVENDWRELKVNRWMQKANSRKECAYILKEAKE